MKKIFTLLSAAVLGLASLCQAAPAKVDLKTAGFSDEFKALSSQIAFNKESFKGEVATRYWTDNNGNYWTAQFLFPNMPIMDAFKFTDADGNVITPAPMEENPFVGAYIVFVVLSREGAMTSQGVYADNITTQYVVFWPSHFIWDQIYDNSIFENDEPIMSKVDLTPVPFETLANTPDEFCRSFVETDPKDTGFQVYDVQNGQIASYTLIHTGGYVTNDATGKAQNLGSSYAQGAIAKVDLLSSDGDYVNFEATCCGTTKAAPIETINLPIQYEGVSRIDGFEQKNVEWPELGGVHIFDCGVVSSKTPGEKVLWSGEFGDLQKYMVWGYDKGIKFTVTDKNPDGTPIESLKCNDFKPYLDRAEDLPATESFADHLNYFRYIIYSAKGEGPQKNIWTMTYPEDAKDEYFGQDYIYYVPTANCIITSTYKGENDIDLAPTGLSRQGALMIYHDYQYTPTSYTQLGTGTLNGFQINAWDDYDNYITVNFTGDIVFHNDPDNYMKTTTFNPFGDLEMVDVEEVAVSDNVAPVYYNLQGVRVNNPENGLFIEVRGKDARKVFVRK